MGAEADCSKNICCRVFPDSLPQVSEPAGPNGNSKCDTPVDLADSMLEAINELKDEVRFTIFTGDVVEGKLTTAYHAPCTDDHSTRRDLAGGQAVSSALDKRHEPSSNAVVYSEVTNDLHEFNTQLASKLSIPVFPAIGE